MLVKSRDAFQRFWRAIKAGGFFTKPPILFVDAIKINNWNITGPAHVRITASHIRDDLGAAGLRGTFERR